MYLSVVVRKKTAFTLIELLVVIAIIAILAAIIFPVFARAKASAKQSACVSNLKQIGSAITLYMSDFDDLFPYAIDSVDRYHPEIWDGFPEFQAQIPFMPLLSEAVQPYVKSVEVFRCAADDGSDTVDDHPWLDFGSSPSMFKTYGSSYFFRTEIAFKVFSQTRFSLPSNINVYFDAAGNWHGSGGRVHKNESGFFYFNKIRGFRYSTLYGDMHVKNVSFDKLREAWSTPLE